jgi:hypothetical protein
MFKVVSSSPNIAADVYVADASVTFTKGNLCYRDTSSGEIKENTATTGDATNVEGIVASTITTPASDPQVELFPIHDGLRVVADCTNTTAADQLNKAHLLTSAGVVNNTNTHSTDVNAVFVALRMVGVAADKKLYGYITRLGQVTA